MLVQKGDIRVIADTRKLADTQAFFGGPMPAATLYAADTFIKKNPHTTQALTNAMVRALKWLQQAAPSDLIKVVPENFLLGDRTLYLDAFASGREAISPDGLIPAEGPATALRTLTTFAPELAGKNIDLSKTFTNEFVEKALLKDK
jgi:NitT/TauT family transport system substrate-binding protein